MKTKIIYIFTIIFSISILNITGETTNLTSDTLSMNPGYTNDIFYSMNDGVVADVERAGWDIAFYTSAFSAGIIINEGSGVDLYTYPNGDTSSWASVDSSGLYSWKKLVNSAESWEDGAFNRNATGHPNYGWGTYNSVTHDVVGDSIYIINSPEAGFKKLWIVKKVSIANTYIIKYSNLDGTNEQSIEIDVKPFINKNFIYFSLTTNETIDREPSANWDILFTKYYDITFDNEGNPVDYLVTGATSNINREANKYYPVGDDFNEWASISFDTYKNVIGYNWKSFSMSTFSWVIEDSTVFFVKNEIGDVYKLVFTYWEGSATGVFAFNKEVLSLSTIYDEAEKQQLVSIYPNPASGIINVSINDEDAINNELTITDLSGRMVYSSTIRNSAITVNATNFESGLYFVSVIGDNYRETVKLVVR